MTIEEYKELIKNDKLKIGLDVAEDEDEINEECDSLITGTYFPQ